ncbi:MAG: ATP-grasp domain-containing protein, partial [Candidatus Eisenbacteria bacterium]|nr:ATP-grasp domain-containing protein [Candidatus Latescibacterota bacterium]MBD3301021.1 ATP-grasp domain-containing protein [Candidatus Eisenbacteria bacterium]
IGPARSGESYLNIPAVVQAAEQNDCCAIHPGYGFLAENALFAEVCEQAKMSFIGPTAAAIRAMGDKATARETMRAAGLPVIPGSQGTLPDLETGRRVAEEIGFPVLLKATAGGGGRGMRRVDRAEEFEPRYREATLEAEKAFGDPRLYMEKYIVDGRHIEFQVLGDAYGEVIHLGERECSAQRRHQKLVEESPSPVIDAETRHDLGEKIRVALRAIGYRNAGTVEFFRDRDGSLYFMEMNARLQVEHPVTEMVTGRDLVAEQIRIAAGEPLSFRQDEIEWNGHAIECRINAEDPFHDFRPSPGEVTAFSPPEEIPGGRVRVDTHVRAGYRIPVHYDSLIAKLIVHGADREAARIGTIAALQGFGVEGVETTIPVHLRIMEDPEFAAGRYDTGFIARLLG